jgi:hypothetical protein
MTKQMVILGTVGAVMLALTAVGGVWAGLAWANAGTADVSC